MWVPLDSSSLEFFGFPSFSRLVKFFFLSAPSVSSIMQILLHLLLFCKLSSQLFHSFCSSDWMSSTALFLRWLVLLLHLVCYWTPLVYLSILVTVLSLSLPFGIFYLSIYLFLKFLTVLLYIHPWWISKSFKMMPMLLVQGPPFKA